LGSTVTHRLLRPLAGSKGWDSEKGKVREGRKERAAGRAYGAPPTSQQDLKRPTSKGRGGDGKIGEERGKEERGERNGEVGKGRERERKRRGKRAYKFSLK